MVPEAGLLGHAAKTEQGWLCQVHHQPGETMKEGEAVQFPHQAQIPKAGTQYMLKSWGIDPIIGNCFNIYKTIMLKENQDAKVVYNFIQQSAVSSHHFFN